MKKNLVKLLFTAIFIIASIATAQAKFTKASNQSQQNSVRATFYDNRMGPIESDITLTNHANYIKFENGGNKIARIKFRVYGLNGSDGSRSTLVDYGTVYVYPKKMLREVVSNGPLMVEYKSYVFCMDVKECDEAGENRTASSSDMSKNKNKNKAKGKNKDKEKDKGKNTGKSKDKGKSKSGRDNTEYVDADNSSMQQLQSRITSGGNLSQRDYQLAIESCIAIYYHIFPLYMSSSDQATISRISNEYKDEIHFVEAVRPVLEEAYTNDLFNTANTAKYENMVELYEKGL